MLVFKIIKIISDNQLNSSGLQ